MTSYTADRHRPQPDTVGLSVWLTLQPSLLPSLAPPLSEPAVTVPPMTAPDDLLQRIENDPALAQFLAWPGDFDITRRDPVEDVRLPAGTPLVAIAGCGAGGTYFLCGEPGSAFRPVLYADSEGQATLIGADLAEALTLIAVLPYWQGLAGGGTTTAGDLITDLHDDHPGYDFEAQSAAFLTTLGLPARTPDEAATTLLTTAARTAPHYIPHAPDNHHARYDLLLS